MLRFLLLLLIILMQCLLQKGLVLGIILGLFWIKGKQIRRAPDEWEKFFLSFPERKFLRYVIAICLTALFISCSAFYFVLKLAGYQNCLLKAFLLFFIELAIAVYRWCTKGKDALLERYREIPKTILEKQNDRMPKQSER